MRVTRSMVLGLMALFLETPPSTAQSSHTEKVVDACYTCSDTRSVQEYEIGIGSVDLTTKENVAIYMRPKGEQEGLIHTVEYDFYSDTIFSSDGSVVSRKYSFTVTHRWNRMREYYLYNSGYKIIFLHPDSLISKRYWDESVPNLWKDKFDSVHVAQTLDDYYEVYKELINQLNKRWGLKCIPDTHDGHQKQDKVFKYKSYNSDSPYLDDFKRIDYHPISKISRSQECKTDFENYQQIDGWVYFHKCNDNKDLMVGLRLKREWLD